MGSNEGFIRKNDDNNLQNILKLYTSYVERVVEYGSQIINWIPKGEMEDDSAISTMLLRHQIELTDALSILISKGAAEPSKILLRSAFETNLYLHFIQDKNTKQRAYSYMVVDHLNQIKDLKKMHSKTKVGIEQTKLFLNEKWLPSYGKLHKDSDVEQEIKKREDFLLNKKFENIIDEYYKLKKTRSNISWYQLFNGPSNIAELAAVLNKKTFYVLYYRPWSNLLHGSDVYDRKIFHKSEDIYWIADIRLPINLAQLSKIACNFSINSYGNYVMRRHPEKISEYREWEKGFTSDVDFDLSHEYVSFSEPIKNPKI